MRLVVSFLLALALAGAVSASAPATHTGPPQLSGRVTEVSAGDTLQVQLTAGRIERVRVIGIAAPAPGSCFAQQSADAATALASGERVTLTADRNPAARDGSGRLLAYVALPGGVDLGRALVREGAAQIDVWGRDFARFVSYVPVQRRAETANRGLWGACAADLAVSLDAAPTSVAVGAELTFTVTVTNHGPLPAEGVDLELRTREPAPYVSAESADGTCRTTSWLGTCSFGTLAAGATATATFVVEVKSAGTLSTRASVRLDGCVRGPCKATAIHDADLKNDETAALTTVLSAPGPTPPPPTPTPPPATPPPPPPPAGGCSPAYPTVCIPPPPPDLDCADIPYRDFAAPLNITNPDPHDFDGDEDGVGCQFNDY